MMPSCTATCTEVTHERIDGWWADVHFGTSRRANGDAGNDARLRLRAVCASQISLRIYRIQVKRLIQPIKMQSAVHM